MVGPPSRPASVAQAPTGLPSAMLGGSVGTAQLNAPGLLRALRAADPEFFLRTAPGRV
jgi:hypothetical protein